ncbi:MAG: hypothetical protein ABFS56_17805 [Pseudomonadota bacterium]
MALTAELCQAKEQAETANQAKSKVSPTVETVTSKLIPPPSADLEVLYELTMFGNLERVQEKVRQRSLRS